LEGLATCYTLAIPFFTSSLLSTLLFSLLIEGVIYLYKDKLPTSVQSLIK